MAETTAHVSLPDNLAWNLLHVLPYYLRGIFTRNRLWMGVITRYHPDPAGVRFIQRLRRKYGSDYLVIRMLGTRSLLVLDPTGIRRVLERSPVIYADADLKRRGMSHFQPGAVTISRGQKWQERRHFNEAVLDKGRHLHGDAGHFNTIVGEEVARLDGCQRLNWDDLAGLFERITLRVVLGEADTTVTSALSNMMREANRVVGLKKSRYYDNFYQKIRTYLAHPPPHTLAARCAQASTDNDTRVANQVPHWLFAMADTLAVNTARTLALIAAHTQIHQRLAGELAAVDLTDPRAVDGLLHLENCLQESMRLWPSVFLLVRKTLTADVLGGTVVPAGTQVIIHNGFNHRDGERLDFADRFHPDFWQDRECDYRFNHLSNGPQDCAGRELALFIAKATLARLLVRRRVALVKPALDPKRPLPQSYNHFALIFEWQTET